jgi:hypothetical protein
MEIEDLRTKTPASNKSGFMKAENTLVLLKNKKETFRPLFLLDYFTLRRAKTNPIFKSALGSTSHTPPPPKTRRPKRNK